MIRELLFLSILQIFGHGTASVGLVWDGSSDKTIANYRVYYADVTGKKAAKAKSVDVGKVTQATISNLAAGHTYYFVVTAFNAKGRESAPSNLVKCVAGSNETAAGSSRARPNDQKKASPHR
jgi:predicted phage tail protein